MPLDLQLRHLECFRTLMLSGTMTRAAELLQISQPSISNTISDLEQIIGFPLFVRRSGRLSPTPEAQLFFEEVSRSLAALASTTRAAKEIRDGRYGRLSIAAYPSISTALLPRVISVFVENRPGVLVRLVSSSSQAVKELASMQQCDFAIAELPTTHPSEHVDRFTYRCECMLPVDHPLAALEVITPADLDGVPFVSLFRDHATYHQLASAFSRAGARWNVVVEVEYYASACELVGAGCGVGVVDPVVSRPFTGDVVRRPFEPPIIYEIGLLYPGDGRRSTIAGEFISLLKEHLDALQYKRD